MFRERHELRQHAHPPARGLPRPGARARRRVGRTRRRRDRQHPDIEEGLRLAPARRSTTTTARSSWTGSCPGSLTLEQYAAATTGRPSPGPACPPQVEVVRRRGDGGGDLPRAARPGRLAKRYRFDAVGSAPGQLHLGPGAGSAGRLLRHRDVDSPGHWTRAASPRRRGVALPHRDGREDRARLRPYPARRIGHAALAGRRREKRRCDVARPGIPISIPSPPSGAGRDLLRRPGLSVERRSHRSAPASEPSRTRASRARGRPLLTTSTKASRSAAGTARRHTHEQVRRDRIAEHVLPVTSGAVDAVLPPAFVDLAR